VFLDPPWEAAGEYGATLALLGGAHGRRVLAPGALVVAEHMAKSPLPAAVGALVQTRTLKQGDAALSFYGRSGD
jgi:16S rRNA (guanine966-N2)-methyltransferase